MMMMMIIFLNSGMLTIQTTAKNLGELPNSEVRQHRRGLGRGLRSGRPRSGELHPVPRRRGFHVETMGKPRGNTEGIPMGFPWLDGNSPILLGRNT